MNAEQFFNNGFGQDVITVHRNHVINLMTAFAKHYHEEQLMLGGVVGRSEQFYCASKKIGEQKCKYQCFDCKDYKHT